MIARREIAFFPPMTGGLSVSPALRCSHERRCDIRIQQADFGHAAGDIRAQRKGATDIGAVVSFSGICRGARAPRPSQR